MAVTQVPIAAVEPLAHRSRAVRPFVAVLVGATCTAAFVVVQLVVERWAYAPLAPPPGAPAPHFDVVWPIVRSELAGDVARFLGLALIGYALVWVGRRRWFWLPAVVYSITPLVLGWGDESCGLSGRTLAAVGSGWRSGSGCDGTTPASVGPVVFELGLVLLPAGAAALAGFGRREERRVPSARTVATTGLAVFASWAVVWAWPLSGHAPNPFHPHLLVVLPLIAFGGLLGTCRPSLAWTLPLAGVLLATGWAPIVAASGRSFAGGGWSEVVSSLPSTWPALAVPVIAASGGGIARVFVGMSARPLVGLVALNALNLVDATLTAFAVRSEGRSNRTRSSGSSASPRRSSWSAR
jgi:hypothetical protein